MSSSETYLALFTGDPAGPRRAAWDALPEAERRAKEREGMFAWHAWVDKHQKAIVSLGGPLGRSKRVTANGVEDTRNQLGAYTVVRAESIEAATDLFQNHPHFAIFPGDAVEIMPVMPIPGA